MKNLTKKGGRTINEMMKLTHYVFLVLLLAAVLMTPGAVAADG